PIAPDDAPRRADSGAVHENARSPVPGSRLRDGRGGSVRARHVAGNAEAADFSGNSAHCVAVDVEDRYLSAEGGEPRGGSAAKAGAAASHQRRMSVGMHFRMGPVWQRDDAASYAFAGAARKRGSMQGAAHRAKKRR